MVAVRSTTPLRGVDRGLVRRAVGRPGLRIETGDFDVVGLREVRFVVVGRFDGVISTMSSSLETMAARGVNLAGEMITTCGVVFLEGGVYSPEFTATGFVGVVVVTGSLGLGIGACIAVRRNMLFPSPAALDGSDAGMFLGGLDWETVAVGGERASWVVGALREVGGG